MSEDRELNAVLVCLAPLGARGLDYVDITRREFSYRDMLESQGWSSGERQLIIAAGALWNQADGLDLCYLATTGRGVLSGVRRRAGGPPRWRLPHQLQRRRRFRSGCRCLDLTGIG